MKILFELSENNSEVSEVIVYAVASTTFFRLAKDPRILEFGQLILNDNVSHFALTVTFFGITVL